MTAVIITIHLILALGIVFLVLIQKSEGGGLGIGGGSGGGMGGFMTGRATANLLTRATGVVAGLFMLTSITLALMAGRGQERRSVLDEPPPAQQSTGAPSVPALPELPGTPTK